MQKQRTTYVARRVMLKELDLYGDKWKWQVVCLLLPNIVTLIFALKWSRNLQKTMAFKEIATELLLHLQLINISPSWSESPISKSENPVFMVKVWVICFEAMKQKKNIGWYTLVLIVIFEARLYEFVIKAFIRLIIALSNQYETIQSNL